MSLTIHQHRSDTTDPAERGETLGRTWADQIRLAAAQYEQLFVTLGVPDAQRRRVVEQSAEQIASHAPELAQEIAGMARGANIAEEQAMMLNARTEILATAPPVEECSATVFWPDGGVPRTLQTWDWRPDAPTDALVHTAGEVITFCEFGQVAKIGVNARGLGLHFNILKHQSDGRSAGVPVHAAARIVLERAGTVAEAIDVVRSLPYAASSVFTVASRNGDLRAACLELSPAGVGVIEGAPGRLLSHTNHFLDTELAAEETPATPTSTSRGRLAYLDQRADLADIVDPVERAEALAASPVCVRPAPGVPSHLDVATRATISLDLEEFALGVHPGGPRDVRRETWQQIGA